ncbi:MAG TPA: hypothetical protein VFE16_14315 [Candidatus Cybelea sp.]|jgi:hypothetical protein|nr:hypothetical protein [Candidatus Cybelea sp.]
MWKPAISSGLVLVAAAVALAGCGVGTRPNEQAGGGAQSSALGPSHAQRRSYINFNAKNSELLYVTEIFTGAVDIDLGSTWSKVGDIYPSVNPFSLCVDAAQDVYVVDDTVNQVSEYAHGGVVPIKTLTDHQGNATACAVNPSNDDLAVANNQGPSYAPGNVILYRGGKGSPIKYTAPGFVYYNSVAYDLSGDLFVSGAGGASPLAELPMGQKQFETLSLNQTLGDPQSIAWDGTFLAIADRSNNSISRFRISGTKAVFKGQAQLYGVDELYEFCFAMNKSGKATAVITADPGSGTVAKWDYPAGGTPTQSISASNGPTGVALSE